MFARADLTEAAAARDPRYHGITLTGHEGKATPKTGKPKEVKNTKTKSILHPDGARVSPNKYRPARPETDVICDELNPGVEA